MRSSSRPLRLSVLLALLAAGTLAWSVYPERPARAEEGANLGYVGESVCTNCHQEVHAAWSGSSHAHTFERATPLNMPPSVVDGEKISHAPGTTQYRAPDDGRFIAETVGPDGMLTDYHLSHVVGRMRVRMFVATMPDGRQQVLPAMLEVPKDDWFDYTKLIFGGGGTRWGKAPVIKPGDASFWTGPVRSWDTRCARCHVSGYEARRPQADGTGPRYRMRALGVDCETCHGPGAAHVGFREEKREGDDPMLRFRDLAHDRALGVCLQCHMESEVVKSDFLPGDDIWEFRDPTLLIDPERVDASGRSLELIYDGVPFSSSRCVQEGKLTCVSCHDPHGSPNASQLARPPEDNAQCTRCHEEIAADIGAHTHHELTDTGSQCISCHMPFLTIERGHGVVADHSISTPTFALRSDRVAQNACVWCHQQGLNAPDDAPKLDEAALKKAHAEWYPSGVPPRDWVEGIAAARRGDTDAHLGLLQVARDTAVPRVARASAVELLGRHAAKVPLGLLALARDKDSLVRRRVMSALAKLEGTAVDQAFHRALDDPSRAVRVAAARGALEGWKRVQADVSLLARVLAVLEADALEVPEDDMRWFLLGAACSLAGDDRGALAAYERQAELDAFATNVRKEIERLRKKLGN